MALLEIRQLKKSFAGPDGRKVAVIDVPEFDLESGMQVGLSGESGLGKTTLLHLIAGILKPDSGRVVLEGEELSALPESGRDRVRAMKVGYIFQSFHLLSGFTCLENVELGMAFGRGIDRVLAKDLLSRVGLSGRLFHDPRQLSTGQQQRLAVARALSNRPKLVLADEPTGNLDSRNGREALHLIRETCRELGAALLLVSHDPQVLTQFEHVRELKEINRANALGEAAA